VLGLISLKIKDAWGRQVSFLIQNKYHCHMYRFLRGRAFCEKLPKIPLFGPSVIHQFFKNI
jgi:hypothetical protein